MGGLAMLIKLLREKNNPLLDDGMDNLPEPRFQGLTPEEMKVQSPIMPRGALPAPIDMPGIIPPGVGALPQPVAPPNVDPDEERIRRMYTDETQGMKDYRAHVANAPDYNTYKPSLKRSILSGLLAAGTTFATDDAKLGLALGSGVRDMKYNNAVRDYRNKGKGLEDIANLDERRKGKEIQAETAIEGIRTRKEIAKGTLQQKISDENRKHSEELERAKDRDQVNAEKERHDREIERIMGEGNEYRRDAVKDRAENRIGNYYDPEKNENVTVTAGEAKARGLQAKVGDKEITREKFIRNAKTELESALAYFEKHPGTTGQTQGRISKVRRYTGIAADDELLKHMNTLESYRGESLREKAGTALTKTELAVFDPVLSGITQGDKQLQTNLKEAIRRLGEMSRATRVGGKKTVKLKDGTEIEVEE